MNVIIEHIFCQYSDEATALYLRIINVILLSSDEEELRASMEKLRHTTNFDKYFIYGFGECFRQMIRMASILQISIVPIFVLQKKSTSANILKISQVCSNGWKRYSDSQSLRMKMLRN